jgi:2,4-dienoyl-CoA reductase-like NADH-dependent reductase (Old Yellow Enzyme family)
MSADSSTADLFTPFDLGPLHLRNRFVMAPMTRNFSPGGVPGDDVATYYERRAAGETGLIITEGTYVDHPAAGPSPDVPHFYGDDAAAGWLKVVAGVHGAGGAIMPQLWHLGAERKTNPRHNPEHSTVSPSGLDLEGEALGEELSVAELDEIIASFIRAAVLAKDLGFDGAELHGAHGYLFDQFFWTNTNRRQDAYGGDLNGRARFAHEVVAGIRDAVGPEFPLLLRISQWKSRHYDERIAQTPAELETWLGPLVEAGVSMMHCSTRRHWEPAFEGSEMGLAGWVKKVTGVPTITVGSVGLDGVFTSSFQPGTVAPTAGIDRLVEQFERGEFDLVAVGRALLGDPDWVRKVRTGDLDSLAAFDSGQLKVLA